MEDETVDQTEGEFEVYTASLGVSGFQVVDGVTASWFIGVGTVSGDVISFNDVLIASGTQFGKAFDPKAVMLNHWGTVTLTVNGCSSITVDYASIDASFSSGRLNAQRLINIKGLG